MVTNHLQLCWHSKPENGPRSWKTCHSEHRQTVRDESAASRLCFYGLKRRRPVRRLLLQGQGGAAITVSVEARQTIREEPVRDDCQAVLVGIVE